MKLNKIHEAYRHVDFEKNVETGDSVKHEVVDKLAVKRYTSDSYEYNDILHRHNTNIKGPKPAFSKYHIINGLQEEIHAQPIHDSDLHVFSGTSFDIFNLYLSKGIQIGKPIEFIVKAFTSTSTDLKIATSYAKTFSRNNEMVRDDSEIQHMFSGMHDGAFYQHALCFELNGKKALKIDDSTGGYFSDEEKEFILPHSINVRIHGLPTYDDKHEVIVWDAEILTDFSTTKVEMIEYDPREHEIDVHSIMTAISEIEHDHTITDASLNDYVKNLKSGIKQMANDFVKHGQEGKIVAKYINLILTNIAKDEVLIQKIKPHLRIILKLLGFTPEYLLHGAEPGQSAKRITTVFDKIMD